MVGVKVALDLLAAFAPTLLMSPIGWNQGRFVLSGSFWSNPACISSFPRHVVVLLFLSWNSFLTSKTILNCSWYLILGYEDKTHIIIFRSVNEGIHQINSKFHKIITLAQSQIMKWNWGAHSILLFVTICFRRSLQKLPQTRVFHPVRAGYWV